MERAIDLLFLTILIYTAGQYSEAHEKVKELNFQLNEVLNRTSPDQFQIVKLKELTP